MTGPADVATTLDDLERKLKDLERELASAGDPASSGRQPAPPASLSVVAPAAPAPAPAAVPMPPPAPAPAATTPATPGPSTAAHRDVVIATPQAPAARVDASRLIADAHQSVDGQLTELMHFREHLERSAQELLREYNRLLGGLPSSSIPATPGPAATLGGSLPAPAAPAPAAATPPPAPAPPASALPAAPPPSWSPPPAPEPDETEAAAPAQPVAEPLPPSAWEPQQPPQPPVGWEPTPAPAPASAFLPLPGDGGLPVTGTDPAAPAGPGPNDQLTFAGQVTVDAGPFEDISTLSSFEQALGHLPGTQDVYVRGFEGSRALIDLVLGAPVAVGDELRKTAPLGFTITAATSDHLSITIDGGWHA
ncbi:hypothetical protein DSM112329_05130 [Paraconexibacter sp. AEG42_29]|uniref:Uncharacterized protein n=1 Tax=Paraconexibacter sp. AEG42_29 TaxID=2997339 RepID=A0AAU7B2J8_9ACTN